MVISAGPEARSPPAGGAAAAGDAAEAGGQPAGCDPIRTGASVSPPRAAYAELTPPIQLRLRPRGSLAAPIGAHLGPMVSIRMRPSCT